MKQDARPAESAERSARQQLGDRAEELARSYLESRGLHTVNQNYRVRGGELDLVMQDGDTLVFVEVRYRSSQQYGGALASVDAHKQRRLLHAAQLYLLQFHRQSPPPCRFDVIAIAPGSASRTARVRWLQNAFGA